MESVLSVLSVTMLVSVVLLERVTRTTEPAHWSVVHSFEVSTRVFAV